MQRLPENHVLLETESGLILRGVSLAELTDYLGNAVLGVQPSVSWNALVGEHDRLRVSARELSAAIRRWFAWEDVLVFAAHSLNMLGSVKGTATRFGYDNAGLAFSDNWPASIAAWDSILASIRSSGRTIFPMNEHGLLWLILDALREPWGSAEEALPAGVAHRRFARLVLVAADGMSLDDAPAAAGEVVAPTERAQFSTSNVLVAAGRLGERDVVQRWLVRAHELYCELLPKIFPNAAAHFESVRGMTVRDWIVGVCSLVMLTEVASNQPRPPSPVFDFRDARGKSENEVIAVLRVLAKPAEHYARRIADLAPTLLDRELPVQALREAPVLRLDEDRYIMLHDDFVLAQADDGILYTILDALPERAKGKLLTDLGGAIETYGERVLRRCADAAQGPSTVLRVGTTTEKRCDFIWNVDGFAVFAETKRVGLAADHLLGRAELAKRLSEQLGTACRQILNTCRAAQRDGVAAVCPGYDGPALSERPVAVIVTHRPIFAWFSTRRDVIPTDIREEWEEVFGAPPAIWSLSELELLEAAIPEVGIRPVLQAIADDHPEAFAGVAELLARRGYRGLIASDYYGARYKEIFRSRSSQNGGLRVEV